ncbi:alpha/beta fold hydrolase [Promicromonospora iranensis]|uniref:Pimeloyl-ACP methyl ester carboxylesterase n=1 Tax=Promicromonospora iranensis TaxID=1105144 RepID=A0ABU2CUH1_9MICO|nr:alpha/beta hydrolase [Promicromonospora iranensis]MDR7384797.1 pimeloyl-ACP methyl ester carboxylesterase [Promicromonospora iranensis]
MSVARSASSSSASPSALPAPVFVDVGGARVATYVLEPAGRPPVGDVVLCHGTPWSARVWEPVALALSEDHRVFLWDMPGYGASSKDAADPVDLVAQRRRFAALLRHWSLDRPQVVAHDIGGAVALGAHLLEDADVAGLFLLDIVALDPWGSPFFRLVAENESVFAAVPGPLHAALVKEYIAGAANNHLPTAAVETLAEPWLDEAGQAAFYRQIAQLSPADTAPIVAGLGQVRCPVRIGWAVDDPWIPFEQAARLRAALPGEPEVVEFAGRGHLVPLEDADAVGQAVREWLDAGA